MLQSIGLAESRSDIEDDQYQPLESSNGTGSIEANGRRGIRWPCANVIRWHTVASLALGASLGTTAMVLISSRVAMRSTPGGSLHVPNKAGALYEAAAARPLPEGSVVSLQTGVVSTQPIISSRTTPEPPIEVVSNPAVKGLQASPRRRMEAVQPEAQFLTESEVQEISGGEFGLFSDWRKSILLPESGESIRGGRCLSEEHQDEVQKILARRQNTPRTERVAAIVRVKDFGRYMPEWIAYHYVIGVDEFHLYNDQSTDGTAGIVEPFVDAGILSYHIIKLRNLGQEMQPLNAFLEEHLKRRNESNTAPKWLLIHDSDEYIYPVNVSQTLPEFLELHDNSCCIQVNRVQYGSSGYRESPPGLLLESFLQHASPRDGPANRLPKFVANLDPAHPELGLIHGWHDNPHVPRGCQCDLLPVTEIRMNHYLGSLGDFIAVRRRYWEGHNDMALVVKKAKERDRNDETSDEITHWACATREILARIVEGWDLRTRSRMPP